MNRNSKNEKVVFKLIRTRWHPKKITKGNLFISSNISLSRNALDEDNFIHNTWHVIAKKTTKRLHEFKAQIWQIIAIIFDFKQPDDG